MRISSFILAIGMAGLLLFVSCSTDPFKGPVGSPLRDYGQLQVIGTDLCDQNGNPVQLQGISSLDIYEYRTFVNLETMEWLRDDWGMELFRAAMYTQGSGRNLAERKKGSMIKAVEYSLEAGVYVLIDWHILSDGDPMKWLDESKAFFGEMAQLYKDYPNVIYEICNEPNGDITWAANVKPYAEEVIPVIRQYDPDSIIIVGSPTWSQDVDIAASDPLEFDNIMYSAHFYAGTHGAGLRNKIEKAISLGAPIFITEWGTTQATGDDGIYPALTADWMNFINQYNLSWANWSLCNVDEDSAILLDSAGTRGQWLDSDIRESGLLVRNIMRGNQSSLFADGFEQANFLGGRWPREGVKALR
ncbi:MAG: glycoside hydrolase family 5 protein, partial [Spirochaetaceae bacterium]|nr:glycoside hydrolase family 5 protein [Spirochaetaceae bacterium]